MQLLISHISYGRMILLYHTYTQSIKYILINGKKTRIQILVYNWNTIDRDHHRELINRKKKEIILFIQNDGMKPYNDMWEMEEKK